MRAANDSEVPFMARGDSFRGFYDEHVKYVLRGAQKLGVDGSSIDDVVQRVFLVAYRRLPDFRILEGGGTSIKGWMFGILLRVVREHRRASRRRSHYVDLPSLEMLPDAADLGPHGLLTRREAIRLTHILLDELDDDKREVFLLAEVEELTTIEIARLLGIKRNTVGSRLRSARRQFQRLAKRYGLRDNWKFR